MTVAGTSSGGAAANQLNKPSCLYMDQEGSLYICDFNNGRVQKWSQNASSGVTVTDTILITAPGGVAVDRHRFLYVSDEDQHHVIRYPPGSTIGTLVAGRTNIASSSLSNLHSPGTIVIDDNLSLYINDQQNRRIVQWSLNATIGKIFIDTFGSRITGMAFVPDSLDYLYLSSELDESIYLWRFNQTSPRVTTKQVNPGALQLRDPWKIKTDPYGNVYVADSIRREILIFCPNATLGKIAINGTTSTPTLTTPRDIALDSNLNLYVVDEAKNQVYKYERL